MSFDTWEAPKDPDEDKDYGVDWSGKLAGDTISSSSWILDALATSDGLGTHSESKTATTTTVWFTGGVRGHSYLITNRVITTGGRTYDKTSKLKMKDL